MRTRLEDARQHAAKAWKEFHAHKPMLQLRVAWAPALVILIAWMTVHRYETPPRDVNFYATCAQVIVTLYIAIAIEASNSRSGPQTYRRALDLSAYQRRRVTRQSTGDDRTELVDVRPDRGGCQCGCPPCRGGPGHAPRRGHVVGTLLVGAVHGEPGSARAPALNHRPAPRTAAALSRRCSDATSSGSQPVLRSVRIRMVRPSGSLLLSRGRDRLFGVCAGACRRQGRSSGGALHLDGSGASAPGLGSRPRVGVRKGRVGG